MAAGLTISGVQHRIAGWLGGYQQLGRSKFLQQTGSDQLLAKRLAARGGSGGVDLTKVGYPEVAPSSSWPASQNKLHFSGNFSFSRTRSWRYLNFGGTDEGKANGGMGFRT